jgi:hypothetical protein
MVLQFLSLYAEILVTFDVLIIRDNGCHIEFFGRPGFAKIRVARRTLMASIDCGDLLKETVKKSTGVK